MFRPRPSAIVAITVRANPGVRRKPREGIANVLESGFEKAQTAHVAAFFLHVSEASELDIDLASGFGWRHPTLQVFARLHLEVEP